MNLYSSFQTIVGYFAFTNFWQSMTNYARVFRPTVSPTTIPTFRPSEFPSQWPSSLPTNHPSFTPTLTPTLMPSGTPSFVPTLMPTNPPTGLPTLPPTQWPSSVPSPGPSFSPTWIPSVSPSGTPTWAPTWVPTDAPTILPSCLPTSDPSGVPSVSPTTVPSLVEGILSENKQEGEPFFTSFVIGIISIAGFLGLAGILACCFFVVPYWREQRKKEKIQDDTGVTRPSTYDFGQLPAIYSGSQTKDIELAIPTTELFFPSSVGGNGEVSPEEVRLESSHDTVSSSIPLILSTALTIDTTKRLGGGGFGIVYSGTWESTPVAVKQLKTKHLPEKALASFRQEAQQHGLLRHPNIILLYGICLDPERPSMVMELMAMSLYHLLHSNQALSWSTRCSMAQDMALGLHYLHNRHILHRDLKSHNVLLDQQNRAKLSDFGLSKTRLETARNTTLTSSATAPGTLYWMAPEILHLGAKHTKLSDVYAFGMVCWEISSREHPFQEYDNADRSELVKDFIKEGRRPTIPAATPPTFSALIARCWAQRAADRPTCIEIVNTLNGETSSLSSALTLYEASVTEHTIGHDFSFKDPFSSTLNTGSI